MLHQMDYVLVDKNTLSLLKAGAVIEGFDGDLPLKEIDKLHILVPVHNLEARISGKALLIDDLHHQIGEIRSGVQVYRIDKLTVLVHGFKSLFCIFQNIIWRFSAI